MLSGESGAGKTFNTRNILQYLAHVGIDKATLNEDGKVVNADGTVSDPVTDRMLDSSEILVAFGNATMPRNDDSSRFGKLYKVSVIIMCAPAVLQLTLQTSGVP